MKSMQRLATRSRRAKDLGNVAHLSRKMNLQCLQHVNLNSCLSYRCTQPAM